MAEQQKDPVLLTWQAPLAPEHSRGVWWHIAVISITLALVAYAIFYEESWSMAAVMGLLGIMVFLYKKEESRLVQIDLKENGVTLDNKFYAYQDCKSFWRIEEHNYRAICLDLAKPRKHIKLPLGENEIMAEAQEILERHLPKNSKGHELWGEKWARRLKL